MTLKRDAASDLGIGTAQLAASLRTLVAGQSAGNWRAPDDETYDIQVRLPLAGRSTLEQLRALRDPSQYRWDVSFFGNLDAKRYPEHVRRVEFLAYPLTCVELMQSFRLIVSAGSGNWFYQEFSNLGGCWQPTRCCEFFEYRKHSNGYRF